jgi:cytochrome P450
VVLDRLISGLGDPADPYLDAVVRETLRQRPILPVTARRLTEPMSVGEFTFPAGWTLMPCIYLIHQDPGPSRTRASSPPSGS